MQRRKIKVLRSFTGWKEDAVTFKTNASIEAVHNLDLHAFEDVPGGDTAVTSFYERILLGDQFPGTLIVGTIECVTTPMFATLFVAPDLVLEDQTSSLVRSFTQTLRYGAAGFAHVPRDHQAIIDKCQRIDDKSDEKQIMKATRIIESYLRHGRIVDPLELVEPEVFYEEGPFVAFEAPGAGAKPWIFRQGFTCGLYVSEETSPQFFKKSTLVRSLSLRTAKDLLGKQNEPDWNLGNVFLSAPDDGTNLTRQELLEIAIKSISK